MREIDLSKTGSKDFTKNYAEHINIMYMVNYEQLRTLVQRQILFENADKQIAKSFVDSKISKSSFTRAFSNLGEMNMLDDEEERAKILAGFRLARVELMKAYNKFYRKDKNFEDCFDGLEVIDQKFIKDAEKYYLATSKEQNSKFEPVANAYEGFLDASEKLMNYVTLAEILIKLKSDFTSEGNKSITYGKPGERIALISGEEIKELIRKLVDAENGVMVGGNALNNNYFRFINQDDKLSEILNNLLDRSEFANISNHTRGVQVKEKFLDMVFGVPKKARKLKKLVDRVYYHQNEITQIDLLTRDLCLIPEFNERLSQNGGKELIQNLLDRAGGRTKLDISNMKDMEKHFEEAVEDYVQQYDSYFAAEQILGK